MEDKKEEFKMCLLEFPMAAVGKTIFERMMTKYFGIGKVDSDFIVPGRTINSKKQNKESILNISK